MQVFRIMGMPDKIIAFDELPERLLEGFELNKADGFPRHWKEFLGKKKRKIPIPPEKDFLTGQVRRFDPIIEEDYYFYLVDMLVNPVIERWKDVCEYVKQNVKDDFRLKEKIEDMAVPLASNKTDGVTLEPEDVVIIPLKKELEKLIIEKKAEPVGVKCSQCDKEFDDKRGLRMHTMKKHPLAEKKEVAPV